MTLSRLKPYSALFILVALCLTSLILNITLNYPYRPFPSDELDSYSYVLTNTNWLANRSEILFNSPLHIFTLVAVKQLTLLFGLHWFQTFLLTSACCISGAALLLGLTVHKATGQIIFSTGTMILFLASAWTQSYLHFYTYAPITVLFMMASLFCFTCLYLSTSSNSWLASGAGMFAGLFFLSGSSAKLLASILIATYVLLVCKSSLPRKKALCFKLTGTASILVIVFLPLYLGPLVAHLRTNVNAGNGIECLQKYGFLPTTPFPSFFYLLSVYSPELLIFLLISLAICAFYWKKLTHMGNRSTMMLSLMGMVLIHTVVLDLLPFTKLGRTQFPLFVIVIIALSLLYAEFPSGKLIGQRVFLFFLFIAVPLELSSSMHTWQSRREAASEFARLPSNTSLFVLDEDPHHDFITKWLQYDRDHSVSLANVPLMVQASKNRPTALIIGPTGLNSGKSILRNSIMDDFYFSLPPNIGIVPKMVKKLPYYAHYPLFMMEEETSQCFFFRHQVPDYRSKESQLTLYFWPAADAGQKDVNRPHE